MRTIKSLVLALWMMGSSLLIVGVEAAKTLRGKHSDQVKNATMPLDPTFNDPLDNSNNAATVERHLGGYRLPRYTLSYQRYDLRRCEADCRGNDNRCAGSLVCRYVARNPGRYSSYCRGTPNSGLDYCVPYVHYEDDDGYHESGDGNGNNGGGYGNNGGGSGNNGGGYGNNNGGGYGNNNGGGYGNNNGGGYGNNGGGYGNGGGGYNNGHRRGGY